MLENGYAFGIAIDPSAIPSAPSYSTTASTWSGRGARANTRRGVPSSQFIWSKSWISRSTGTPPDLAGSPIQSFQSAGGDSRSVDTESGRPRLPVGEPPLQLDVLRPEAQHEPDHEEAATPLRRGHDRVGVLERQRDRLLEQDVLAGGEGRLGPLAVQRRRQADVDGVDLRVPERRQEIVGQLGADRGRDRGGPVAPTGGDRLDAHPIAERAVVRGV